MTHRVKITVDQRFTYTVEADLSDEEFLGICRRIDSDECNLSNELARRADCVKVPSESWACPNGFCGISMDCDDASHALARSQGLLDD